MMMNITTLLMVMGLFFGVIPDVGQCTLDAADCAVIQEAGTNMRSLTSLTVDELNVTLVTEDGAETETFTFNISGDMAWMDGHLEMDMELMAGTDEFQQPLHIIIKDGTIYSDDDMTGKWDHVAFDLDVRTLPTLTASDAQLSGGNGSYLLTLPTSPLSSDVISQMDLALLTAFGVAGEVDESILTMQAFFFNLTTVPDTPYIVTYTIEDGYITQVQSAGTYSGILNSEATTSVTMTLEMSNHNGDVRIEAP